MQDEGIKELSKYTRQEAFRHAEKREYVLSKILEKRYTMIPMMKE